MLEKWELIHFPCEKDRQRWCLRVRMPDAELQSLLLKFKETKINYDQPIMSTDTEFNWIIYIYGISDSEQKQIEALLGRYSSKAISQAEENLPQVLEELIENIQDVVTEYKITGKSPSVVPAEKEILPPIEEFWELKLNPKYTFEEFIIGPNNRFTHAAALAVAENPGRVYNPLFIYGGVGLGKTHLMQAIGHYVKKKNTKAKILYVTSEKFVSEVIDSIHKGTIQQFRDRYRQLDLLLVDDVQFLAESESTQEEFFHTFNILHNNNKQIVLTSDRPPKQLATLEDRLKSRFEWGLIADIKSPSLETRVAILKKKSEVEKVTLDDNILLYVASKLKSNIRELEGFLKRINAYATLTNQPVDMELVKNLMLELLPEEAEVAPPAPVAAPQPIISTQPPAPVPQSVPGVTQPVQIPISQPISAQTTPVVISKPSAPKPVAVVSTQPTPVLTEEDKSLPVIEVAFFYPETKEQELIKVKEKFREIIRKHRLKFRLESAFDRAYSCHQRINYTFFVELCKTNKITITVVLGPPPDSEVSNEDFMNFLISAMEPEKISLQYIPWQDLTKDYRYLNLALDITLTKHRGM